MTRKFRQTKVLDANIWLTDDDGPMFRISQLFTEPGRFVVEERENGAFYHCRAVPSLDEAKSYIQAGA